MSKRATRAMRGNKREEFLANNKESVSRLYGMVITMQSALNFISIFDVIGIDTSKVVEMSDFGSSPLIRLLENYFFWKHSSGKYASKLPPLNTLMFPVYTLDIL